MKKIFEREVMIFTFSTIMLIAWIIVTFQSCQPIDCTTCPNCIGQRAPITKTQNSTMSKAYGFDEVKHVTESGMHYAIIYYNGVHVVNITNDSLTFVTLKTQKTKDSLQVEVFKKYLSK